TASRIPESSIIRARRVSAISWATSFFGWAFATLDHRSCRWASSWRSAAGAVACFQFSGFPSRFGSGGVPLSVLDFLRAAIASGPPCRSAAGLVASGVSFAGLLPPIAGPLIRKDELLHSEAAFRHDHSGRGEPHVSVGALRTRIDHLPVV